METDTFSPSGTATPARRVSWGRTDLAVGLLTTVLALLVFFAPLPVAGLAALAFVGVGARRPVIALAFVVMSLPLQPLTRAVGSYAFSPTEVLIVLSTACTLARVGWTIAHQNPIQSTTASKMRRGLMELAAAERLDLARRFGDPVILLLLALFVAAAVASLTASVTIHPSVQSLRVIILEPAVFYLLVVLQVRTRRELCLLVIALVAGGVLISLFGLWQDAAGDRIITAEAGLRRIRGFYGSPNNLGLFLGRTIPVGLALTLWWARWRLAFAVVTAVLGLALLLTYSVGAWIAVGLSVLLVAALRGRRTFVAVVVIGAIAVLGGAIAALSVPRLGSHFDLQSGTSSIRLDVWQSGIRMLAGHSLRGIGLDNFLYYYQNGYRLPSAWQEPNLSHPHNFLLDFWLSLGLPGPLVLGGLLGRFAELVHRGWSEADSIDRGLYAGAVGALAATLIHGTVDNSFFLPDLAVLFWLMFAIVAVPRIRNGT